MSHQSRPRPLPVPSYTTPSERVQAYYWSHQNLAVDDSLIDHLNKLSRAEQLTLLNAHAIPAGPILEAMVSLEWVNGDTGQFLPAFLDNQYSLANVYAMLKGISLYQKQFEASA